MNRLAAGVLLVDVGASLAHDRVLLVRNTLHRRWETPGGWVKNGESLDFTAARELREETGLQVEGGDLDRVHIDVQRRFTYTTFVATRWGGDLRLSRRWEIRDARWLSWTSAIAIVDDERRSRLIYALQHVVPISQADWGSRRQTVARKRRELGV